MHILNDDDYGDYEEKVDLGYQSWIFAPRLKEADARSYHDDDACLDQMFALDWERVATTVKFQKVPDPSSTDFVEVSSSLAKEESGMILTNRVSPARRARTCMASYWNRARQHK